MKLFNSLSILAILSAAYAMPEDGNSGSADAAVAQETDAQDRFFGGGYPFGYGPGLVNANVGVGNLVGVGANVLGPGGLANVGANVGGLVGVGASVLGPDGIARVGGHVLGLPINVGVGGPGWGGYPGYPGYPGYGGYPPYGGSYPPYGNPPPYGGYPRY
ncbi:hypothetical protein CONCODRAFT_11247 [Conidiobolus coronatus NRRL 28638]|uniref:Uncharacterized protein n=1 Tax=Conidiobolus coronatus (strain ATCC 28846 / CBS 209.66 / NRRL 28638) TaxID=796925 RepID=A0A137NVK4_CONC2|nr:hypothetical protein CONCODRAFT_11247 [Conidiobolus coronatus NRRL 28638]|eukprot:KXN66833.1 hypothetical protein CONCODRAFT_11247 [Conidiobolus coronatus NRRL 28638]